MRPSRPAVDVTTPSHTPPLPPQKTPLPPFPPSPGSKAFQSPYLDPRPRSFSLSDNGTTHKPLPAINPRLMEGEPVGRASLDSRRPSDIASSSSVSSYRPTGAGGRAPLLPPPPSSSVSSSANPSRSQSPLPPPPQPPSSPHRPPPPRAGSTASSQQGGPYSNARSNASFVSTHTTGGGGGRPAANPYDMKLVNASFATLPPLPIVPTSANPHPTPDPSAQGGGAMGGQHQQVVYPHPTHPTSALSTLFLQILPLFNGAPIASPLESLNDLVRTHIQSTLTRLGNNPSRAIDALTADLRDLIGNGMLTLGAKVGGVEDGKLVARLVSIWLFFFSGVVPYVEGVFLPLGNIRRNGGPGGSNTPNPSTPDPSSSMRPGGPSAAHREPSSSIDVRLHLLTSFLLSILRPLLPRVIPLVSPPNPNPYPDPPPPPSADHLGKLQQMVLVLMTQADPDVVGRPGEIGDGFEREGLEGLLRAIQRAREGDSAAGEGGGARGSGATISGSDKLDRRGGWIAGKHRRRPDPPGHHDSFALSHRSHQSDTPTNGSPETQTTYLPPSTSTSTTTTSNSATPRPLPRHLQRNTSLVKNGTPTSTLFSLPSHHHITPSSSTNNHTTSSASSTLTAKQALNSNSSHQFQSTLTGATPPMRRQLSAQSGGGAARRGQDGGGGGGDETGESEEEQYLDSLRSPDLRGGQIGGSPGSGGSEGEGGGRRHSSPVF